MRSLVAAVVLVLLALAPDRGEALVATLWMDGGPALFDAYDIDLTLGDSSAGAYPMRYECDAAQVTIGEGVVDVVAGVAREPPEYTCERSQKLRIGRLSAGRWDVRLTGRFPDGSEAVQSVVSYTVEPRGIACNADPANHALTVWVADADAAALRARVLNDAAWRASVGNILLSDEQVAAGYQVLRIEATFDPLTDPYQVGNGLSRSGYAVNTWFPIPGCAYLCPGNDYADAIEYRRTDRDRYIFVTDTAERDALDAGVIAGWTRTGESMNVITRAGNPRPRDGVFHPVYRFWGGSVTHEPSHFFTASQQECAVLRDRKEWNWTFERSGFWAYEWKPEGCPSGVPLYRSYNNGIDGAPAHRYSTKRSVIDEMISRGWVDEGPVMCVAGS